MPTNVAIPHLGDSISQATILRWIKKDGDYVAVDDPVVELETDKTNVDLPAPAAGILRHGKKIGDVVKIGEVVANIEESAKPAIGVAGDTLTPVKAVVTTAQPPASAPVLSSDELQDLNPAVRAMLAEHNLSPQGIIGTGPHGRLLKEDVLRHLETGNGNSAAPVAEKSPPIAPPVSAPVKPLPTPTGQVPGTDKSRPPSKIGSHDFDANGIAREPISKIRNAIARNLKEAQNTAAILTTFNEVDMSAIMDLRTKHKERFEKTYGVGLGFMSFFARAVVLGLRDFPKVNAFIDGNEIIYHNYVNLGIAVSSDRGLTVPVLKSAELMSFAKVESEIKRVAAAVKEGKLGLQEMSGGTFTITNGGVFGSMLSTPILLPPQSAILGMHAITKRAVVVNDEIKIRPMMYVALSYDHRLIDGRDSVSFLVKVKEYLEDPTRLMLEI